MTTYSALPLKTIACKLALEDPACPRSPGMTLRDHAINVMTDLAKTRVIVIRDVAPIDEALAYMKHSGVRLLFVVDGEFRVLGMITSYDILGEKPLRYMQSIECMNKSCSRDDVLVRDIMEPVAGWKVVDLRDVARATVGHIVSTFKAAGRRHLVVSEAVQGDGPYVVRGLFSASELEKQLGMSIDTSCVAAGFADVERVLAHRYG